MASCHTHAACYGIFYSPTEYAEFTEPPTEMSSHGFLLRRVWHLAIPTPPAMGYSPTEYAEFTEPPTEMSSHGFHRFTQILMVRCSPTEFTEYTEFGSVGMAGMPYPPTSVLICAICGRLFSARSFCAFRAFCGNIFSPTDFTDLHRYLWCAVLPQNSQNTQNLAAWVCSRDAIPSYICAHPCHLWESFLCQRFCVFGAFRGSFFTACSVGAAETAAPPGVIHGSSAHISPPHHLTISPQQHHFTSNPAFCMSSQYCGYDFVTTCGSLMRSPGNTIAAGANAIAMRWSS